LEEYLYDDDDVKNQVSRHMDEASCVKHVTETEPIMKNIAANKSFFIFVKTKFISEQATIMKFGRLRLYRTLTKTAYLWMIKIPKTTYSHVDPPRLQIIRKGQKKN